MEQPLVDLPPNKTVNFLFFLRRVISVAFVFIVLTIISLELLPSITFPMGKALQEQSISTEHILVVPSQEEQPLRVVDTSMLEESEADTLAFNPDLPQHEAITISINGMPYQIAFHDVTSRHTVIGTVIRQDQSVGGPEESYRLQYIPPHEPGLSYQSNSPHHIKLVTNEAGQVFLYMDTEKKLLVYGSTIDSAFEGKKRLQPVMRLLEQFQHFVQPK